MSTLPKLLSAPLRQATADRFDLIEELGAGATGTVWRAVDRQRGAEVALKVLHHFDSGVLRRFKQEFRTLANLRHPNVVRFHELFEVEDRLFFSMELIHGVDLLCWVWGFDDTGLTPDCAFDDDTKPNALAVRGPKVDESRLRSAFAQLTEGLTYVHEAGYLHRDLKPSNLIVDRDGHLRILDFGLSASILSPHSRELSAAVGTVAYMAPEVAELRQADVSADYYGVGILLYEALTGRTPFGGDSVARLLAAKATEDPAPPSTVTPGVPEDLDRLCLHLLARDVRQRAGADELRRVFHVRRRGRAGALTSEPLARGSGSIAPMPVVGRNHEVDLMLTDLARTRTAGFQCRMVVGSSGVGKSALADAFSRRAAAGSIVLHGRCLDREAIPFRAVDEVIDALSSHLAMLPASELARVRGQLTSPLGPLLEMFPVLRVLAPPPNSEPPLDVGSKRQAAFAGLRELLTAVALTAPMALVIDDLHLADPDSLDLLQQVFRGRTAPPLLIIGLARPGLVVDRLCAEGVRASGHRLDLGPLQGPAAELAARTLATHLEVPLSDARSIAIDTGGHPGFMYEILRRAEPGAEDSMAGDSLPSLAHALTGAISALTPVARRVLELCTMLEGVCSVELASEVLDTSPGEIAAALDLLVDANLVVATGREGEDVFEVYHERIRDVAESALDAEPATALHRALATALERRDEVEPAALVRHWMAAGEPERAALHRARVAAQAVASLELWRAAQLHEQSLATSLPIDLERAVRGELAQLYASLGRHDESAAQSLAAARLATGTAALALSHQAAEQLLCAANIEAGGQVIEEVVGALGYGAPSGRLPQLAALLGDAALHALVPRRFKPRPSGDQRANLVVDALATAAIRVGVLEPLRGRVYQQRHLRAARALGDGRRYARALCAEAVWCASAGPRRRPRVDRLLAEATEVSRDDASPLRRGRLELAEAMSSLLLGEPARARAACDAALETLARCGSESWWERRQARTFAVRAYWLVGDFAALRRGVLDWSHEALEQQDAFTHVMLTATTGNQIWLVFNDVAGAEAQLAEAERKWETQRIAQVRWHVAAARAALELYRRRPDKALAILETSEPAARRAGLGRVQALHASMLHLRLRVSLALAAGDTRSAHLARAHALAGKLDGLGAAWSSALAQLATATYLEHHGALPQARDTYLRAEQQLTAAQLGGYAAAARWRLAALPGAEPTTAVARARPLGAEPIDPARFYAYLLGC